MTGTMFAPLDDHEPAAAAPNPCAFPESEWCQVLPARVPPPHHPRHPKHGEASRVWTYRDAAGAVIFLVCRFDLPDGDKEIVPFTYGSLNGREGWHWKAPLAPRPLYGLDRLARRREAPVIVCEGEKSADAAERLFPEYVAITSPNGARAADKADWTPLAGRNVTIWPDHDEEGTGYAADVARLVSQAGAASVRMVQVPNGFPPKWDLADDAPTGWTPDRLRLLLDSAKNNGTGDDTLVPGSKDDADILTRLAKLPPIAYDRERESAAKQLRIRVTTLDDQIQLRRAADDHAGDRMQGRKLELTEPKPWPAPVDGAELLDALADTFNCFLALPDGAADALALWVIHTHTFEHSPITPRLAITSPEKRCGKTTCLRLVGAIAAKPRMASNITTAAMFRFIEAARPCLLIDEADSFVKGSDELRGIINSGHARDGTVIRTVGDDHETREFSTWAPVAIACIGELPGTIADRSITVPMRRRRRDENVERLRLDRLDAFQATARKCARWATDHGITLAAADPAVPDFLHDRAADNWRPLLAIADAAGRDWPARARQAARLLSADDAAAEDSVRVMLLADIKAIFDAVATDRLPSTTIVARLADMEHRPWPEWTGGKAITTRQLARLLAPFEIVPTTIRIGDSTPKGYLLTAFTDAFARYLPADPQHRHNADEFGISGKSSSATAASVLRIENSRKSCPDADCGDVADRKGESGEEEVLWTA